MACRGSPRHSHKQHVVFSICKQETCTQTSWSQYFAPLPGWGNQVNMLRRVITKTNYMEADWQYQLKSLWTDNMTISCHQRWVCQRWDWMTSQRNSSHTRCTQCKRQHTRTTKPSRRYTSTWLLTNISCTSIITHINKHRKQTCGIYRH